MPSSDIDVKMDQIRTWLSQKHVGDLFSLEIKHTGLQTFGRKDLDSVSIYARRLPHWEFDGSTYFITFRVLNGFGIDLAKSVPKFSRHSPADIIEQSIWFGQCERYIIDAYVIMPNHVHLLIIPLPGWSLSKIMKGLKGFTAREINKLLIRNGSLWQDENFDHLIRNEADWQEKFDYIHENPGKSGLVKSAYDWPYSSLVTLHSKGRLESLPHTLEACKKVYY